MTADASSPTYRQSSSFRNSGFQSPDFQSPGLPTTGASSRLDTHLLVVVAILLTSAALAVFASKTLGLPDDLSMISGCGFAVFALLGHLGVSRGTGAMAPSTANAAPGREPRAKARRGDRKSGKKSATRHVGTADRRLEPTLPSPGTAATATERTFDTEPAPDHLDEAGWQDELGRAIPAEPRFSNSPQNAAPRPAASQGGPPADAVAARSSTIDENEVHRVEKLVRQLAENVRMLEQTPGLAHGSHAAPPALTAAPPPLNSGAGHVTGAAAVLRQAARGETSQSPSPSQNTSPVISPGPSQPTEPVPVALRVAAVIADSMPHAPSSQRMVQAAHGASAATVAAAEPPTTTNPSPPRQPTVPAAPPQSPERDEIIAALNAQRIDVFLEPILDIREQKPQHFEVSIALRTAAGASIDLAQAERQLGGTGLLPLIDQSRIVQAAQLADRLAGLGKTGSVLTGVNGETLADDGFKRSFADGQRTIGAFPGHLVLAMPQSAVAHFTEADWQTLTRLRSAGFAYAITDITTLDMDFSFLAARGFVMARLDAVAFLDGLPTEGGVIAPADICRHLATCGLALVVGHIADDQQLARIFGFGVLFGQGQVFGGPRAVNPTAQLPPASASSTEAHA